MRTTTLALIAIALSMPAQAEEADYGRIALTGLARDSWPYNAPGETSAMVCNVNGPDGFLAIRQGPGTEHPIARKLNRLAEVTVDTRDRQGHWVRVQTAERVFDVNGTYIGPRSLHVTGWAHDGFLCDFLDF